MLLRLFSAIFMCLFRLIAVILTGSKTMIEPQVLVALSPCSGRKREKSEAINGPEGWQTVAEA